MHTPRFRYLSGLIKVYNNFIISSIIYYKYTCFIVCTIFSEHRFFSRAETGMAAGRAKSAGISREETASRFRFVLT
jgi:pectate lyase